MIAAWILPNVADASLFLLRGICHDFSFAARNECNCVVNVRGSGRSLLAHDPKVVCVVLSEVATRLELLPPADEWLAESLSEDFPKNLFFSSTQYRMPRSRRADDISRIRSGRCKSFVIDGTSCGRRLTIATSTLALPWRCAMTQTLSQCQQPSLENSQCGFSLPPAPRQMPNALTCERIAPLSHTVAH